MACEEQLIEEYFLMFDADGDQRIEKKELRNLLKVVYKQAPDDATLHQCLQQYASDGSGTIDLNGFKQLYRDMPTKPKGMSLKTLFNKYDKSGHGVLEIEGVKQFLMDLGEEANDSVVKKLMDDVDVDGDGKVNFKEFCLMFGRSISDNL